MKFKRSTTVFFLDRCLGKHPIIEILRSTGVAVEVHDDHFPQNAQDVEWIPEIGRKGWVVLTKDERIARNLIERRAIAYANIRMFTLVSKQLSGEETAIAFQDALQSMLKFIEKNKAPFIAKVYKTGKVQAWKKAKELQKEISL
ncbi:hypothetical protein [Spirulina subsalsa]|uniref:PIN-like domain-containing protein n=1 Tax=Spirulina subsalsa TaxID=54311 RepID=UPI0003695B37|nr:hypothetical protein [Spirulina subsalsa]